MLGDSEQFGGGWDGRGALPISFKREEVRGEEALGVWSWSDAGWPAVKE